MDFSKGPQVNSEVYIKKEKLMVLKIKDLIGIDHKLNEFIEDLSDENSSKIIGGAGDISEPGDIEKEIEPFESMSSGTEDPTDICEVTDPSGGCLIV